jgi:hypothetical protein
MHKADLSNAELSGAIVVGANLSEANLHNVKIEGAQLTGADLRGAHLSGTNLREATLGDVNLSKVDLRRCDLRNAHLERTILAAADLSEADLCKADLRKANLTKSILTRANLCGANLNEVNLTAANLRQAILCEAHLHMACLCEADLTGADFREADLTRTNLAHIKGAERVHHLVSVRFNRDDAIHFDTCVRKWSERWLDWEHLRIMGRLPLFGVSYTALVLLPVLFYGLSLYNSNIVLIRLWAAQIAAQPGHPFHSVSTLINARLHPQPIPRQSFLLLVSVLLLAIASTLYTLLCPLRIKEFSREQWCHQSQQSLLHYWPLAWERRWARLICAMCYALGGAGALWVLGTKVWRVAWFIWKNSSFPRLWW